MLGYAKWQAAGEVMINKRSAPGLRI